MADVWRVWCLANFKIVDLAPAIARSVPKNVVGSATTPLSPVCVSRVGVSVNAAGGRAPSVARPWKKKETPHCHTHTTVYTRRRASSKSTESMTESEFGDTPTRSRAHSYRRQSRLEAGRSLLNSDRGATESISTAIAAGRPTSSGADRGVFSVHSCTLAAEGVVAEIAAAVCSVCTRGVVLALGVPISAISLMPVCARATLGRSS